MDILAIVGFTADVARIIFAAKLVVTVAVVVAKTISSNKRK
ncbi:hypothetical protein FACS1894133_3020 [Clostridia bacterium]|nr:hypothetical protein FACS1894133_3020 [Clostridia bacterium]